MCVRGMQAKIPVLPFDGKLFGNHHIFQPDLFFLFCEFILLQSRPGLLLRSVLPCLFSAHILSAVSPNGTIKFYGKPHAAKLPWDLP